MKFTEKKYFEWDDALNGKTLEEAIPVIEAMSKTFGKNAVLRYEWTGYENIDFFIEVEREPTFEELNAEKIKREKKEKADRAKFLKLKDEYGW